MLAVGEWAYSTLVSSCRCACVRRFALPESSVPDMGLMTDLWAVGMRDYRRVLGLGCPQWILLIQACIVLQSTYCSSSSTAFGLGKAVATSVGAPYWLMNLLLW